MARAPVSGRRLLSEAVSTAAAGVVAYGGVHPRAQLFGPTICHTNSPRKLAITFDDGPNPAITPKLLDLLDRYKAPATFFLIGRFGSLEVAQSAHFGRRSVRYLARRAGPAARRSV